MSYKIILSFIDLGNTAFFVQITELGFNRPQKKNTCPLLLADNSHVVLYKYKKFGILK